MLYHTHVQHLPHTDALAAYQALRSSTAASILLESGRGSDAGSRFSLVGCMPALSLVGQEHDLHVELLQPFGQAFFEHIAEHYATYVVSATATTMQLHIPPTSFEAEEALRPTRLCPAQVLRSLLQHFAMPEKNYVGLYGALSYRFIYPYEDLPRRLPDDTPDFKLYLFDTLLFINHLTQAAVLYCTQSTAELATARAAEVVTMLAAVPERATAPFTVKPASVVPTAEEYQAQVQAAVQLCATGELLELVLSRKLTTSCAGDSLQLYAAYRSLNPAPYQFYLDCTDEVLLGTSPEMMLRVEGGRAMLRPISGSSPRGRDAVEEHDRMLALLNSVKEKSELDMLIDLARNDLARVCQPGVVVEEYRAIDKYATVMHTTAQVVGQLPVGTLAYDALVACMNAGTLTGAPKLAAMHYIEAMEQHTRGYYGGAIGYLLLNNEINTGILIRSAFVRDGVLSYLAGATLLVGSDPALELHETQLKTDAFLQALHAFTTHDTPA